MRPEELKSEACRAESQGVEEGLFGREQLLSSPPAREVWGALRGGCCVPFAESWVPV